MKQRILLFLAWFLAIAALFIAAGRAAQIWTVNTADDVKWLNANTINSNVFASGGTTFNDGYGGMWSFYRGSTNATNVVSAGGPMESVNPLSPAGRWFQTLKAVTAAGTNIFNTIITTNIYIQNIMSVTNVIDITTNSITIHTNTTFEGDTIFEGDTTITNLYIGDTNFFNQTQFSYDPAVTNQVSIKNQPYVTNLVNFQYITLGGLTYSFPSFFQPNSVLADVSGTGVLTWGGSVTNPLNTLYVTTNIYVGGNQVSTNSGVNYWTNLSGILQPIDLTLPVMITNQVQFGPGTTNVLYRSGNNVIITNGATVGDTGLWISAGNGLKYAKYLVDVNGAPKITSSASGQPVWIQAGSASGGLLVGASDLQPITETMSLGSNASNGAWTNQYFKGTLYQQGMNDGAGNYSRLAISHSGTNGVISYVSQAAGSAGNPRPHSFSGADIIISGRTPASGAETNYVGAITWDADYIYVWTATNVNKRAALSAW